MARFSSMKPINRVKHVRDLQTAVPVNTQIVQVLAQGVDNPTQANQVECAIGSKINGFFITTEVVASESTTTATPNFYWMLYKNPGNGLTMPNANNVGVNVNKKHVIHQEMVMIHGQDTSSPRNVFKGVIAVPRGMRRMGPTDTWNIQLFIPSTGIAVNSCTQVHYKEFR